MNTYIRIISLIVIALGMSSPAFAQWYPKGNIELIVSAGPGGGNDKTARLVAKILNEKKLVSVPVIVVNKPGAGGVIAQNYLNSFPGSGNHLMVTNPALITNALTGTGTAKYTDITPVVQLFTEYVVLLARPKSQIKSGREVIDSLRKDPDSLTIGIAPAAGAGMHIAIAMAVKEAGIDPTKLRIIPYSNSSDVMTALMGGHIDLMPSTPINVLPQLENETVRVLALTSRKRLSGKLSEIPTFRELGADVEFGNWRGLVGPRSMTPDQIYFWDSVMNKLVSTPEWQAELKNQLSDSQYLSHAASKKFLDDENQKLTRLLNDLGFAKK